MPLVPATEKVLGEPGKGPQGQSRFDRQLSPLQVRFLRTRGSQARPNGLRSRSGRSLGPSDSAVRHRFWPILHSTEGKNLWSFIFHYLLFKTLIKLKFIS